MDRVNKGQIREFTAIYYDVFTRERIDPKSNSSEMMVTHYNPNSGEVIDIDWLEMERKQLGYYTYNLSIDERFSINTMYNVFFRGVHPVDNGISREMEQILVVDQASYIEGLLMSANTCNISGSNGYPCR